MVSEEGAVMFMIFARPVIHAYKKPGKVPVCLKHMDKHTATHTCTYDTHVDRMKDGKSSALNKSRLTCFNLSFIPRFLMLASKALTGFSKSNKRFPS